MLTTTEMHHMYFNALSKRAGKQHKYNPAKSVAICFIELDYSLQGSETSASSLMLPALNPVKEGKKRKSLLYLFSLMAALLSFISPEC